MTVELRHLPPSVLPQSLFDRRVDAGEGELFDLCCPRNVSEISFPVDRFDEDERDAIATSIESGLSGFAPHVAVLDALRALRQPGSSVVLTSIRPTLLGVRFASLYATIQTIALARTLSQAHDAPVIPIVWIESDAPMQADECDAWLLTRNFDVQRVRLANFEKHGVPADSLELHDSEQRLPSLREFLRQTLRGARQLEATLETWMPVASTTFANNTTRPLIELFGADGLVVVEPSWLSQDRAHHLANVVGSEKIGEIRDRSFTSEEDDEGAFDAKRDPLVYSISGENARALRSGGEGFAYDDEPGSRTGVELAAEIVQAPEQFTAGRELGLLVQDLALPVTARIASREDTRTLARLAPLRASVNGPAPAIVPMTSCSLLEPADFHALEKLGLEPRAAIESHGQLEPPPLAIDAQPALNELRRFARDSRKRFRELAAPLGELDPSLRPVTKRSAGELVEAIERLCNRAERVSANRRGKLGRHVRRLNNALFPLQQRQEQVFGPVAICARYGTEWLGELLANVDPVGREHVLIEMR